MNRRRLLVDLRRTFNLRSDQADNETIDAAIRGNSALAGTNLWVLMFAIVIASVGLNVNSTAVIIGAMLISPLMGPIIGIGYGASIHDYELIRQCFRTLTIFVVISLCASTVYFFASPLTVAHAELMARTSPNVWDVLIAFFGGAAGMVGLTRKEKTTLIPGVAIATALMPPICTAGYGLATGQPRFFFGAFFLFLINAVFIATATLTIARILRLPEHSFPDEATRRRGRHLIGTAVILTLAPSSYLAYGLVRQEVFAARADRFVREVLADKRDVTLIRRDIDPGQRRITLTLFGKGVTPALTDELESRRAIAGIADAQLTINVPLEDKIDVAVLREGVRQDAVQVALNASEQNAVRIARLEQQLASRPTPDDALPRVEKEVLAQLPGLRAVRIASLPTTDGLAGGLRILVAIDAAKKLPAAETDRLRRWLKARLPEAKEIQLVIGRIDG